MTVLPSQSLPNDRSLQQPAAAQARLTRSRELFATTIANLYPDLLRRARLLAGGRADADDLVQDTLERALRARRQFRYGANPEPWVRTILWRCFVDLCRTRRRTVPLGAEEPGVFSPALPEDQLWWQALSSEDIREALETLPRHLREVLVLRELRGLPYRQVADQLGIAVATVGTRVLRARRRLRELFESSASLPRDPPRLRASVVSRRDERRLTAA